jgi:hypothetical protein
VHVLEEREAKLAIYAVELSKRVEAIEYREDLK